MGKGYMKTTPSLPMLFAKSGWGTGARVRRINKLEELNTNISCRQESNFYLLKIIAVN
jgi:hypothetical protein